MKIVVTGGTGVLGRALAATARSLGHDVTTTSRRETAGTRAGAHRRVDLVTGDGLDAALAGAEIVIDATNSVRGANALLVGGTRRLLDAAARARVRHFVAISIVGIDAAPLAYYRTKVEQERVIATSAVPWSLLRATQFHDFVAKLASGTLGISFVPRDVPVQPVHVDEVAARLVAIALRPPAGRVPDFAGPEIRPFAEFAAAWRGATGSRRLVIPLPLVGRVARYLRGGGLCNRNATAGRVTFAEWLARR